MIKIDENDPVGELEPSFPFRNVVIKKNTDVKKFYDLQKEIGRGKFGTVFKCRERSTGFKLAAKFISIAQRQDRRNAEREVEIMRELQHPRLIQIYDAYEMNNIMCVVLELIEGGELFERVIDDDFVLTEKSVSVFMRQICEGVAFIHSKNILHLDMKPENILCLTREGNRIKIIDFGLARKYDPEKKLQVLFGTPEFVAPEVVNFDSIGFGTDMWSVGVICYVLLSGLSPFMGETDVATMANVTIAQYDFDDEAFNDISKDAQDFISKLLLKDKEDRMSATDCLLHPWLKRIPPPPTAKVNGTQNQVTNNELDLQKDVLRGIVDRWNCDINGDDISKIIEFSSTENGISEETPKPDPKIEETNAKKKPKRQTSLPNGHGPPPRKKDDGQIKLITKGVVTGLASGFELKKMPEKPKSKMNGEIKKLNGFGDIHNKFIQNLKVNEPLKVKNEVRQNGNSKVAAQANPANVNHGQEKSTPIEKLDVKPSNDVTKKVQNSEEKKPMNGLCSMKNGLSTNSNELNGTGKLPENIVSKTHSSPQNKSANSAQSNETSQNSKATIGSQNCNTEKVPPKEKVELNGKSTEIMSSKNSQLSTAAQNSPPKVVEKVEKIVAEKTEVEKNQKIDSNSTTQSTATESKPKSSPKPQKKSAKSSTDEQKTSCSSSTIPQSTNEPKVDVKISKVPSKSEVNNQSLSSKTSSSRDPSPNTLSPHSASTQKSETPKTSPASSRTSPVATSPTSPRGKKKSIQVDEDDDSFQCMKKRNVLIQNIIENYEQKAQKANADRRPSNMDLLDGDQLIDFFNGPKLTQRRISDITSLLSGSDNVERSIEEMKAFCKNLSQMVRFRQDSITEGDAKSSSKRPKFRISCFSRDVPMMNSSGPCSSNLFNYVPWYDEELSTSWNLAKSNTHSDPGSLRNSPEPLAPPSLTRKILSKFFNNSIEYGMAGVPSSHANTKDKVAEIRS